MPRLERREHAARVSEYIVTCMRKGHVANAEVVVLTERLDGVPELMCPAIHDGEGNDSCNLYLPSYPSTPRRDPILPLLMATLISWELRAQANVYICAGTVMTLISLPLIG